MSNQAQPSPFPHGIRVQTNLKIDSGAVYFDIPDARSARMRESNIELANDSGQTISIFSYGSFVAFFPILAPDRILLALRALPPEALDAIVKTTEAQTSGKPQ